MWDCRLGTICVVCLLRAGNCGGAGAVANSLATRHFCPATNNVYRVRLTAWLSTSFNAVAMPTLFPSNIVACIY